jgi:hypothetical protein
MNSWEQKDIYGENETVDKKPTQNSLNLEETLERNPELRQLMIRLRNLMIKSFEIHGDKMNAEIKWKDKTELTEYIKQELIKDSWFTQSNLDTLQKEFLFKAHKVL